MDALGIFILDAWIMKGDYLPAKFSCANQSIVEFITVDISDPRNFSSRPAHVSLKFQDGRKVYVQVMDIMVITEV